MHGHSLNILIVDRRNNIDGGGANGESVQLSEIFHTTNLTLPFVRNVRAIAKIDIAM